MHSSLRRHQSTGPPVTYYDRLGRINSGFELLPPLTVSLLLALLLSMSDPAHNPTLYTLHSKCLLLRRYVQSKVTSCISLVDSADLVRPFKSPPSPYVRIALSGSDVPYRTHVQKSTAKPVWNRVYTL